jgi:hypothetical protein
LCNERIPQKDYLVHQCPPMMEVCCNGCNLTIQKRFLEKPVSHHIQHEASLAISDLKSEFMGKQNSEMISSITKRLEKLERKNMQLKQQNERLMNLYSEYARVLDSLIETISFNTNNEKLFHFTNISQENWDVPIERIFESYGYKWFIKILPNGANNHVLIYLHTREQEKSFHVHFSMNTFLSSGKCEEVSTQMTISPQTERVVYIIPHEKLGWNAEKSNILTILFKMHLCCEIKD